MKYTVLYSMYCMYEELYSMYCMYEENVKKPQDKHRLSNAELKSISRMIACAMPTRVGFFKLLLYKNQVFCRIFF